MFNLIVKISEWPENSSSIISSRVFEHTEQTLTERFRVSGQLDLEALKRLPTIFLEETQGDDPQFARIGTIISARVSGREIALEYFFDPRIPPIPNESLASFAGELGIDEFEFSRTHWAVKDQDLFKVLFRQFQPKTNVASVFKINSPPSIEPVLLSAMMPFDASFSDVHAAINHAAEANDMRCRRADDIWENPSIIQDVVSLIDKSRIVVCDCSGRNPNVFYEAGIAHTLGREVILITQSESDIPFDLRHLRYIHYLNNGEGREKLSQQLSDRIGTLVG